MGGNAFLTTKVSGQVFESFPLCVRQGMNHKVVVTSRTLCDRESLPLGIE